MPEVPGNVAFENTESKPILIRQLEIPATELYSLGLDKPDESERGDMSPFRKRISEMVGGELSNAILDTSGKHVFRCFTRRSDNQPTRSIFPDSTLDEAYNNLHEFGVELSLEERKALHTSPGHMWYPMLWPDLEKGIDSSFIAVYRNKDGVLTEETGIRIDQPKKESGIGARLRRFIGSKSPEKPSMRDLLVGVVEIDWK